MTATDDDTNPGRLKSRPEFLAVRKGETRRGPFFLLEVLDRKEPGSRPRVGFTVTKKQGNAVQRNRMRRRLKEAVRLTAAIAMRPGHDYVIVGRREVLGVGFDRLCKALSQRIAGTDRATDGKPAARQGEGGHQAPEQDVTGRSAATTGKE